MLSSQDKNSLNNLLRESLKENTGSIDIFVQGAIAYEPVKLNGKYFLTLYIIAPHDFASDVDVLINQQKNVSTFIVIMIEVVAFGIASLALSWNRRLENTVKQGLQN
jgi:hypothetical protein